MPRRGSKTGLNDRLLDRLENVMHELIAALRASRGLAPPPSAAGGPKRPGRRKGRPGRKPIIVRDSALKLTAAQVKALVKRLTELAGGEPLGKDATVFAIAYELCTKIFGANKFSAGDVMAAYRQIGRCPAIPPYKTVDVVQMLRNLAAASIGKMWVERLPDGTFALTQKGLQAGASGQVRRPRGRRPASVKSEAPAAPVKRGPGRPRKRAATPPVALAKRGPGRPRKSA